jgi:hypothetical protein
MRAKNCVCFVVTVAAIVLISEVCFAFDDGDFQYWSAAGASFDIDKDWKFTFKEEFRLKESGGHLYRHHSEVGLVYKSLADWIDLGFNYKQVFEKDSEGKWRQENRPNLNVTLKGKLFSFDLSDRSRLEYRDREDKEDVWRYTNKVTVKLPFEFTELKLKPYLADEVFITLNDDNIDRNRLYAGVSFGLAENIKGDVYYLWQSDRSRGSWTDINVLGTALKISF